VGLGGGPGDWEDYEWVRLSTRAHPETLASAALDWLADDPDWVAGATPRILLVDLDNLRADPRRWRDRMAAVVALARHSDHVFLAGQTAAVRRAKPHLEEFAAVTQSVARGSDLADQVLLDAVAGLDLAGAQVVVMSNDGIFSALADRGPLLVISPGRDALSERLDRAAARVVDLVALESPIPVP
jgi:hypothetical protein